MAEITTKVAVGEPTILSPSLHRRIVELSALRPNWDGEAAEALKPRVLADVVEAIGSLAQRTIDFREPFLAPTFDGFVQMEWHDKKRSLEIEAVDAGWSLTGTEIATDGKHHYFSAECERNDFERLEASYKWFTSAELKWPSP